MKHVILVLFLVGCQMSQAQPEVVQKRPLINLRASFLLFPPTPLFTLDALTIERLSIQIESNFGDTHGVNLKYYGTESMNGAYCFAGLAWVEDELLREKGGFTRLPYAGIGIARRFGRKRVFVFVVDLA